MTVAESTATVADLLKQYGQQFKGCIYVYRLEQGPGSEGFILIDNGTVLAAALSSQGINLHQLDALYRMMALEGIKAKIVEMTDDQIKTAIREAPEAAINTAAAAPPKQVSPVKEKAEYDHILSLITSLPGVAAAAFVADGLPVFQQGKADFEHIAAATEDMVRTGARIAGELQLGAAEQIIIETPGYKVIIAPVSDMFLCVLARGETNLGLIRLNIRSTQNTYKSQG
jgi:predicted regulator of Ras-like GTPase activity (Roadblock/LC7/MglB family)